MSMSGSPDTPGSGPYLPPLAVGQSVALNVTGTPSAVVGAWGIEYLGSGLPPTRFNSTAAQNDAATWHVNLPAGTYTIDVMGGKGPAKGIWTIKDGSTTLTTVDFYAAAGGNQNSAVTGVPIAADGDHAIQIVLATKNASSTGFNADIASVIFTRTA